MDDLRATIADVRADGRSRNVRCAAHDDRRASLSISRGNGGRVLLHCHAGCSTESVLQAAGLAMTDLYDRRAREDNSPEIMATYDYTDEQGAVLSQAVRLQPKTFRQRRPDGQGGWVWNLNGVRRVLYHLSDLRGHSTVWIPEGEKDCDRLRSIGLPATTNAGGAGKWRPEFVEQLQRAGCKHVVVLPDNDPPGEAHGRDVARSCAAAGLHVKLIPLPDLPKKGDVSDYLTTHTKAELLAIAREAPLFDPRRSVAAGTPIALTSLADLLSKPDDQVEWIVEDRVPAGAVVLLVAPPKAGKSTAARELAFAVSRGEPWLGWRTTYGAVWFLALEDKRSEVKKHFQRLGASGTEPIRIFVGQAPADLLPQLQALAEQERPALIVVDTLARVLKAKDFNDYGEITQRFEPLLKMSRATGATLLLLHHGSAHVQREGLDAVLGSTAISGSVDNIMVLKRDQNRRILSSVQRIGPDLEPVIVVLNSETGRLECVGSKRIADDTELGERILEALGAEPEPVTEPHLQGRVEGRRADQVRVLRKLLGMDRVCRMGGGGRKDPYRYTLSRGESSSQDSGTGTNRQNPGTSIAPINPGLFCNSAIQVPEVPSIYREPENQNPVRTSRGLISSHDSCSHVPEVPEVPANPENARTEAVESHKTPEKHGADSGSQNEAYERF